MNNVYYGLLKGSKKELCLKRGEVLLFLLYNGIDIPNTLLYNKSIDKDIKNQKEQMRRT